VSLFCALSSGTALVVGALPIPPKVHCSWMWLAGWLVAFCVRARNEVSSMQAIDAGLNMPVGSLTQGRLP
jgi:hypothetical protein